MKLLFIIAALAFTVSATAHAQTTQNQTPQQEIAVPVMLTPSQIIKLQQTLQFSFDALLKSKAPSDDVQQARGYIQELFPFIHGPAAAPADTAKKPAAKGKGAKKE